MSDRKNPKRTRGTPAGRPIAKEQQRASRPQEARDEPRAPKQAAADRPATAAQEPTVRRGYEAAQDPEPQGDGDPGPDRVSET